MGRIFSNPEREIRQHEDQDAAAALRLNKSPNLRNVLKRHGFGQFQSGLSLACGSGRAERKFIKEKLADKFHGIDVAEGAILRARELAKLEGLDITYEIGDLNNITLDENKYDLVVTQNCLHHVLKLEHLADQILKSMRPGGVLWIQDFIGESQFQFANERIRWVNSILSVLPEKFRVDKVRDRIVKKELKRPEPGKLSSPFEAIRSADIVPVFTERFEVVEKFEWNTIIKYVVQTGVRSSYLENDDTRVIFNLIAAVDGLLLQDGIVKPCAGAYLLTPKK